MTNFEEKLANLRANLEAEKQAFKQERWAQIEAGPLAAFKQQQETTCSEGILALQQQKNAAIAQKTEELRAVLEAEVDAACLSVDQHLTAAQQSLPATEEA